ncbi:glycosyltransferase [Streptomyces sp. Ru87]|nr:glycosyltransferase [Streptomyces sp. Ru87]
MQISFLVYNVYGIGGTIRSAVNLAGGLAARGHTVEIASVYRPADTPRLTVDPAVRVVPLIDRRPGSPGCDGALPAAAEPSTMFSDPGVANGPLAPSRLTDERISAYLRGCGADVVIATRPVLVGHLARHGVPRAILIGQEHRTLASHPERLRADHNAALSRLDAFVTVSEADAAAYRKALPGASARILCIPNCVPSTGVEPSDGASKTVVAAGRLVRVKRYDRLLDAFAKVAAERPDWQLRIYGRGGQKAALRARIEELGLYNQVRLMGAVSPIEPEWAKGAIVAVSSDGESFGMTIVEAMHCGVPVVATDCPYGPGEIITDGRDGLLVPLDGGADAFAAALLRLIDDPAARRRMAAAARARAAEYEPAVVAERYEQLIAGLRRTKFGTGRPPAGTGDGARTRTPGPGKARRRAEPGAGTRTGGPGDGTTRTPPDRAAVRRAACAAAVRKPAGALPAPLRRLARSWLRAVLALPVLRRTRAGGGPAPRKRPAPVRVHARVRAGADGTVTVRLPVAELPAGPLDFVARLRRDPGRREIRLPVPGVDGAAPGAYAEVVVVRDSHRLPEGRWDCYVAPRGTGARETGSDGGRAAAAPHGAGRAGARGHRLLAGVVEQARLVGTGPAAGPDAVSALVPYPTADGYVALRAWRRPAHAETEHVLVGEEAVTVTARALRADVSGGGAVVRAVSRQGPEYDAEVPVRVLGADGFTFRLPAADLLRRGLPDAEQPRVWDLRLVPGPGREPVSVGRLGGDGVDRKHTDVLPALRYGHPEHGAVRLRPYFTPAGDLAISARGGAAAGD